MAQVFRSRANTIANASITLGVLLFIGGALVWWGLERSSYATGVGLARGQPVPFSHQHHVAGLGIDCRYCHTSVETSPFAGMPTTETCMHCHKKIWNDAPLLQPVRDSWQNKQPLRWTRVHALPDFVYFNHSIHINKGVGCSTCHGRVDQMPLTWKAEPLTMQWCLDCHRDPSRFLRPRDEVFSMTWQPPGDQPARGRELIETNHVRTIGLTDCYTCHR